jgi:hypothetical protein
MADRQDKQQLELYDNLRCARRNEARRISPLLQLLPRSERLRIRVAEKATRARRQRQRKAYLRRRYGGVMLSPTIRLGGPKDV